METCLLHVLLREKLFVLQHFDIVALANYTVTVFSKSSDLNREVVRLTVNCLFFDIVSLKLVILLIPVPKKLRRSRVQTNL